MILAFRMATLGTLHLIVDFNSNFVLSIQFGRWALVFTFSSYCPRDHIKLLWCPLGMSKSFRIGNRIQIFTSCEHFKGIRKRKKVHFDLIGCSFLLKKRKIWFQLRIWKFHFKPFHQKIKSLWMQLMMGTIRLAGVEHFCSIFRLENRKIRIEQWNVRHLSNRSNGDVQSRLFIISPNTVWG